jgi:hypothetical protein
MKILALLLAIALGPGSQSTTAPKSEPLSSVAVIGASLSAGFGIGPSPIGGVVTIADVVHASVRVDHAAPRNLSSALVYLNPAGYMDRTMASLLQNPPSSLIALDYLFWAVHGTKSETERKQQLDAALAGLEKLNCPILVGDLPDVTVATIGPLAPITPGMMPSPALRDASNARIREWAKAHKNVTLVPLAGLMKNVGSGSVLSLRGNDWKETEVQRMMQADRLHPTAEGLVVIWIASVDEWLRNDPTLQVSAFELSPKVLLSSVSAKLQPSPK